MCGKRSEKRETIRYADNERTQEKEGQRGKGNEGKEMERQRRATEIRRPT